MTKPYAQGGLALGRITSSIVIIALMVVGILLMSGKAEHSPGS